LPTASIYISIPVILVARSMLKGTRWMVTLSVS